MKKIGEWFDGKKSIISAILVMIVNSDYVAGKVTDPDLYMLAQGIVGLMFIGGVGHKIKKANKTKEG